MESKHEMKPTEVNEKILDEEQLEEVSGGGIQISDYNNIDLPENSLGEEPMNAPIHIA